ncbi:hypothetical protein BDF20DRAFT_800241, partial [Mycotypha africana]|uniref:uncharacterized protein n=1 Tax=Mycotypha africana TaxID=64632 RepID=UPI0023000EFA
PSQEQIDLIRVSWEKVSKLKHDTDDPTLSPANAFGREFFNALYDMDIECKGAFGNAFQQARALSGMIMYIVRAPSLSMSTKKYSVQPRNTIASSPIDYKEMDPAQLILLMKDTGARHYFYPHVKPHFFDLVGPAFVIALKKRLKEEYTEAMGEAWVEANAYIAYYLKIGFNTQQAWEE